MLFTYFHPAEETTVAYRITGCDPGRPERAAPLA